MATINNEPNERTPLFILKPNLANGMIPIFVKRFFFYVSIILPLFIILLILKKFTNIGPSSATLSTYMIIIGILIVSFSMIRQIIIYYNSTYFFYEDSIKYEFEFINIKEKILPFKLITRLDTDISLWDRITKSGDIIIYSANDSKPDLRLAYIKDIDEIRYRIEKLIKINNL
ncbi:hypothetical protein C0585_06090 [Candidatus Woesearchaeota archaeon]|nr:MAG: hypothetical protein C0585_06090 [Candidatus Woesearchaeota archaeon]